MVGGHSVPETDCAKGNRWCKESILAGLRGLETQTCQWNVDMKLKCEKKHCTCASGRLLGVHLTVYCN